ncbi:uncharacterized protein DUF4349 [Allonocardiopsis opalescens]|uniref:Uncharacterized protein DUF4349 n=1 Tax=Allonocardiopsis opalescens TaxID=1144618 RepID=A0A2T0PU13_9ACTN|nr:uncharacterized protein DUF4349 [Allonocardiopsis opalescens]
MRNAAPRRVPVTAVAAVLAAALLAGCSAPGSDSASGGSGGAVDRAAPEAAVENEGQAAAPEAAQDSDSGGGSAEQVDVVDPEHIVYTSTVRVEGADVRQLSVQARGIVAAVDGFVSAETTETAPDRPAYADLSFEVPVADYAAVLEQLSGLGTPLGLEQTAEDVTDEVVDVESRVASQQASVERIRELLADASTLEEVIRLESELSSREADLESLQARQRSLRDRTSTGTIHLHISEPGAVEEEPEDPSGLLGGLASGWRAFLFGADVLLTVVGFLLPFLVLAALVGVPGWLGWRRVREARGRRERPAVAAGASRPAAETTRPADPAE